MKTQKQSNQGSGGLVKLLPRFFLLTIIREGYLFIANLYGLVFHPSRTFAKIVSDRSQLGIFTTAWAGTWFVLLGIVITYLFLIEWSPFGGRLFGVGLLALILGMVLLLVLSGYIAYWIFFWCKRKVAIKDNDFVKLPKWKQRN